MKKRIMIVLAASITLAICLAGCFNNGEKAKLGERYDSEKLGRFDNNGWASENYQGIYDQVFEEAKETQFVIHQKTAVAIAEAVIKEVYPDEMFSLGAPLGLYGSLYYEKEDCWAIYLKNKDYHNAEVHAAYVFIDVNSGAIRAILPLNMFP